MLFTMHSARVFTYAVSWNAYYKTVSNFLDKETQAQSG